MIFEFKDYREFLNHFIQQMPKRGRGQARKLAAAINVQPVAISQVLSGVRDFTPEQAIGVAKFIGLDSTSTEYFMVLVFKARAGSRELEQHFETRLNELRKAEQKVKAKIVEHKILNEEDKAVFYSNWFYSGIRLLSSVEGYNTIDTIAGQLSLSRTLVGEVLKFLVSRGLCVESDGKYRLGVSAVYLDANDRLINSHRRNWRLKAIEKLIEPKEHDLFYSNPCSLSKSDAEEIKKELLKLIASTSSRIKNSPEEKIACLNIDWFEI